MEAHSGVSLRIIEAMGSSKIIACLIVIFAMHQSARTSMIQFTDPFIRFGGFCVTAVTYVTRKATIITVAPTQWDDWSSDDSRMSSI